MVNISKAKDKRNWRTWEKSGAIGTLEDGFLRSLPGETMYEKMLDISPERDPVLTAIYNLNQLNNVGTFFIDTVNHYRKTALDEATSNHPENTVSANLRYFLTNINNQDTNKLWSQGLERVKDRI